MGVTKHFELVFFFLPLISSFAMRKNPKKIILCCWVVEIGACKGMVLPRWKDFTFRPGGTHAIFQLLFAALLASMAAGWFLLGAHIASVQTFFFLKVNITLGEKIFQLMLVEKFARRYPTQTLILPRKFGSRHLSILLCDLMTLRRRRTVLQRFGFKAWETRTLCCALTSRCIQMHLWILC